jgi:hypothetical protein
VEAAQEIREPGRFIDRDLAPGELVEGQLDALITSATISVWPKKASATKSPSGVSRSACTSPQGAPRTARRGQGTTKTKRTA